MIRTIKRIAAYISAPDELDMIEHYQSRAEKLADLWVHIIGLALAAVGGLVLAGLAGVYTGISGVVATAIYALCLILMLAVSTVYNQARPSASRPVLRRLDEAAIFVMIAGSYTPFTAERFEGAWSIGFTSLIWLLAGAGVAIKMFAPRISDKFWSAVYVLFGWLALAMLKPMIETVHPAALILLVIGGVIYTAGVFVFISQRVRFRRAIWHGFVVTGASVHWAAILVGVVLAPAMAG